MSGVSVKMCPELKRHYGYCLRELGHGGEHEFPITDQRFYTAAEVDEVKRAAEEATLEAARTMACSCDVMRGYTCKLHKCGPHGFLDHALAAARSDMLRWIRASLVSYPEQSVSGDSELMREVQRIEKAAKDAELERCAKIAEGFQNVTGNRIAAAIRKRIVECAQ